MDYAWVICAACTVCLTLVALEAEPVAYLVRTLHNGFPISHGEAEMYSTATQALHTYMFSFQTLGKININLI